MKQKKDFFSKSGQPGRGRATSSNNWVLRQVIKLHRSKKIREETSSFPKRKGKVTRYKRRKLRRRLEYGRDRTTLEGEFQTIQCAPEAQNPTCSDSFMKWEAASLKNPNNSLVEIRRNWHTTVPYTNKTTTSNPAERAHPESPFIFPLTSAAERST